MNIYCVRVRVFLLFLDGIGNDVNSYKMNELHTNPHTHIHNIYICDTRTQTNTLLGLHFEFAGEAVI